MDTKIYQTFTKSTALPTSIDLNYLIPGLAAEAGEVAGKYAKYIRDKTSKDKLRDDLVLELGDCLWMISEIGNYLGITLDEMMLANRSKLVDRQNRHALGGSGDAR